MRMFLPTALILVFGSLALSALHAQQVDGRVEGKLVDSDLDSSKGPGSGFSDSSSGTTRSSTTSSRSDTKEREATYEFTANINSLATKTLEKVEVKIYIIARNYAMNASKAQESIVKVLEKNDVTLKQGDMVELKMGTCDFTRSQTRTVKTTDFTSSKYTDYQTVSKSRDGMKYMGCVMEIYVDGKLEKVVENVSASGLDAYKNKVMNSRQ